MQVNANDLSSRSHSAPAETTWGGVGLYDAHAVAGSRLVNAGDLPRRFEREAKVTARLHPAIVAVYEAGAWPSGEPFFAVRLVAGRSLDEVISDAHDLDARLALLPNALAVADAMSYAHSEQVIHRDLKPKNVLVGSFGETVVVDWGLAKDLRDTSGEPDIAVGPYCSARSGLETELGEVMGTPAYMPPEQARGERVDARADVYALGALLFHLFSGRPPVTGRTTADRRFCRRDRRHCQEDGCTEAHRGDPRRSAVGRLHVCPTLSSRPRFSEGTERCRA